MGGDHGAPVVVDASARVLDEIGHLHLILVGQEDVLRPELRRAGLIDHPRVRLHHASQRVEMDDLPSQALRMKKDSSMRVAINLVKEGQADACVSAGNTGALMATARYVLKTLPGIDRPAICTAIPTMRGQSHMLDLGANVDCTPEQLFQFGVMGSVLASAVMGKEHPGVGLLNIGEEEIKGNEKIKQAGRLLAAGNLNYLGFVEGDDIFLGSADVVVADGFVGNVALKTGEGVARMIRHYLKQAFMRNWPSRLAGLIAVPALRQFRRSIDPRRYNGASLLGLRGIVVKSHGGADAVAYASAIREAVVEVRKGVPERIRAHLAEFFIEQQAV
jgi:glycerol-3-phosphate acyltransferase PlsX